MIDSFEILTTSGVVLWSKEYSSVGVNIINSLIKDVFIEENLAAGAAAAYDTTASRNPTYKKERYTLKWTTAKDLGLIFVAVWQSFIHLSWIDKLLDNVKILFTSLYREQFRKPHTTVIDCSSFNEYFDRQMADLEPQLKAMPNAAPDPIETQGSTRPVNGQAEQDEELLAPPIPGLVRNAKAAPPPLASSAEVTSAEPSPQPSPDISRSASPAVGVLTAKGGPMGTSRRNRKKEKGSNSSSRDTSLVAKGSTTKATGKSQRRWDDDGMMDDGATQTLDYSASITDEQSLQSAENGLPAPEAIPESSWGRKTDRGEFVLKDLEEEMNGILSASNKSSNKPQSSTGLVSSGIGAISGLFRNVVGGKTLTEEDLAKPLKAMEEHLVKKNVARDAAEHLCAAVSRDLAGVKTASFTSIETTIRASLDAALSRILTPTSGSSLDLLRAIQSGRRNGRPYVISVVGVNGVGKSTTLAKLAFLLLHNNYRVLVAAADTFRSGAVEQLRVHVRNLQSLTQRAAADHPLGHIDLYERGYGKDAAAIARDAVAVAAAPPEGAAPYDVVLIDTAGRRHNDARLMSSLEPFAKAARPDKILMVGEALVGTDSVAQARHFNTAFGQGRSLDGFVVSKCDTVGEMVGTLVSLVWSTGVPVVAVGIGQHYGDLRGFRVAWARDLLLDGT